MILEQFRSLLQHRIQQRDGLIQCLPLLGDVLIILDHAIEHDLGNLGAGKAPGLLLPPRCRQTNAHVSKLLGHLRLQDEGVDERPCGRAHLLFEHLLQIARDRSAVLRGNGPRVIEYVSLFVEEAGQTGLVASAGDMLLVLPRAISP